MNQNELNFIQEALYEKCSKLLNQLVKNENELKELREYKQNNEKMKAEQKTEVIENVKEKMKK